jgi:DNA-binding NarL/FixJ family response regulator
MHTNVLIVDDHPIVREGISKLIDREHDMSVCGEAEDVIEALQHIEEKHPDVVVVDLSLKDSDGLDLVHDVRNRWPDILVLVLSMHDERYYANRALRAGAKGYLMKDEAPKKVVKAIRTILDGGVYVSEAFTLEQLQRLAGGSGNQGSSIDRLTDREIQVFRLYGEGLSNKEVAQQLSLSHKTVESHIERIKHKLDVKSGRELLKMAIEFSLRSRGDVPI